MTAWSNVSLTFYENKLKIYVYKNLVNKYIIKMQSIYAGKYKKHTIEQTNFHWVGIKMSETSEYLINFLHVFNWYTVSASCFHSSLTSVLFNYWEGMGKNGGVIHI